MVFIIKDLPYADDKLAEHTLDLITPDNSIRPPLIVFVHGGAWRSGDKADMHAFAQHAAQSWGCAIALVNYRLTLKDRPLLHPSHAQDVLHAMEFLTKAVDPALTNAYDPLKLHVAGHSCGAHILLSIFLDSDAITPSLKPSARLLDSLRSVSLSEGLYDLDLLLGTFPDYLGFLEGALGKRSSYHMVSPVAYNLRRGGIQYQIIHSRGDRLVDIGQSEAIHTHLGDLGAHVEKSWDVLTMDHDEILATQVYAEIICKFVLSN